MKNNIKEQVLPIYNELQGYLSQAPEKPGIIFEEEIWNQLNETVDELNVVTEKNYNKFKAEVKTTNWNGQMRQTVDVQSFRIKLSGLISRLYGEYFSENQPPFSGAPSTIIHANQTQVQKQEQQQSVVVDLAMLVAERKSEYKPNSSERSFLDKLGETLKTVNNVKDIIFEIAKIAAATGVSLEFIKKIFGS